MPPKKWLMICSLLFKILLQNFNADIMQNATFMFNNSILNKYLEKLHF